MALPFDIHDLRNHILFDPFPSHLATKGFLRSSMPVISKMLVLRLPSTVDLQNLKVSLLVETLACVFAICFGSFFLRRNTFGDFPLVGRKYDIHAALKEGTRKV